MIDFKFVSVFYVLLILVFSFVETELEILSSNLYHCCEYDDGAVERRLSQILQRPVLSDAAPHPT